MRPRAAAALLLSVGLSCALFDFYLVSVAPLAVPYLRELYFVGIATGRESLSWEFLHRPTLEHVMPLPMALGAFAVELSGLLGANRIFNVLVLVLAAWAVSSAARRIRGHFEPSDVVLPMALLGPAHVFSFVSGFNLQLVLSATLFAVGMAAALVNASGFAPRWWYLALVALVLLPLTGVNGCISAAFLWLAIAGVELARRKEPGERAKLVSLLALAASAFLALRYFPFSRVAEPHARVVAPMRLALEVIAAPFGHFGAVTFPLAVVATLSFLALSWLGLVRSRDRVGAGVLGLGFAGQLVLAVAIGHSRSQYDNALAFAERYVELAAPFVVFAQLGFARARPAPPHKARFAPLALALFTAVSVLVNGPHAVARVHEVAAGLAGFGADARAGKSLLALADEHGAFLYPFDRAALLRGLSGLMLEGRPPFQGAPSAGFVSLESPERPCGSDLVSFVRPSGPSSDYEHAPERVADRIAESAWRAPPSGEGVLELELRDPHALVLVCVMPGSGGAAASRIRIEGWDRGALVASREATLPAHPEFASVFLEAPRVDRVRIVVPPGASIAEVRFAR